VYKYADADPTPGFYRLRLANGEAMKLKGPIITLAAGTAVAATLLVLDLHASGTRSRPAAATATRPSAAASSAAAPPSPSASPLPTPSPIPLQPPATYAGYTTGGAATIAIAVDDGQAVAYLCDGKRVESWLQGTAVDSALNLTGSHNGSLTGRYAGGVATGSVSAGGHQWTFTARTVTKPSGLYRVSAEVRGARIVAGWIVLPDGSQVGLVDTGDPEAGGTSTPAPAIDPATGTATVAGTPLDATPVDGSSRL
jgi:serine/threonine-protein kinase